jgi:hypothetical protein
MRTLCKVQNKVNYYVFDSKKLPTKTNIISSVFVPVKIFLSGTKSYIFSHYPNDSLWFGPFNHGHELDTMGGNINLSPNKKLFVGWDYTGSVYIYNVSVSSIEPIV